MKKKSKFKTRTRKINLKFADMIQAAQEAGAKITVSMGTNKMPIRFPSDPESVRLLISESERVSKLGNDWATADIPNEIAAEMCRRHGWAFALAAGWLRCKLKGELLPESKDK